MSKQIIIVDDGSSDGTTEWLQRKLVHAAGTWSGISVNRDGDIILSAQAAIETAGFSSTVLFHRRNGGKGGAVRTGLNTSRAMSLSIQDADLEYDPNDWSLMLPLIVDRRVADVVYGSVWWPAASLIVFPPLCRESYDLVGVQYLV